MEFAQTSASHPWLPTRRYGITQGYQSVVLFGGEFKTLAPGAYVLPARYDFQSYYRHLVRTPWLSVSDHGDRAKVLLIPAIRRATAPLAVRAPPPLCV